MTQNSVAEQPSRRVLASRRLLFPRIMCRVLIPAPEGRGGRASKRGGRIRAIQVDDKTSIVEVLCVGDDFGVGVGNRAARHHDKD